MRYYPSLPINLGAELNSTITCYVDASFATHTDMKSHTGMIVTVGENGGPLDCKSQVQNMLPDYMTKCMTGKQLYSQIVRAMYHGDEKEFAKQAQLAFQRVGKADGK